MGLVRQGANMSTELVLYEAPDSSLNIYPYPNLNWLAYAERFKFKVPETIITKADGKSVCIQCNQMYSGYQEKCVRPRYGYEFGWSAIHFGHKMVGEYSGYRNDEPVKKSGLYPCNGYCNWNKSDEFYKQTSAFNELNMVIEKMCGVYTLSNLTLDENDAEKWALVQKMDMLKMENDMIRNALKEVVNRLNQGGAGLMGHINF